MYDEWVPQEIIFDYETYVIAAAERTCGPADSASRIYLVSGYYSDYGYVSEHVREPGMDLQFNGISTSKIWADFLNNSLPYQFRDADIKSQEQMVADAYTANQLPMGHGPISFVRGSLIEFTPGQVSDERIVEALYNLVYRHTFGTPKFDTQAVLEFLEKEK